MTLPGGPTTASATTSRPRRGVDVGAFVIAVVVSGVVLFAPSAPTPPLFPNADKVIHLLVFLALALTGVRAGLRPVALGLVLVVYAIVSEVVQETLLPERSGDVTDAVADSVGILAGLVATATGRRALRDAVRRRGGRAPAS